jgi:hypothetical protein
MVQKIKKSDVHEVISISVLRSNGYHVTSIDRQGMTPQQCAQILCDTVRRAAVLYKIPVEQIWAFFDQERHDPEVKERGPTELAQFV